MVNPEITELVEVISKMIDAHIQSWPLCEDRADARVTRALEALFADRAGPPQTLPDLTVKCQHGNSVRGWRGHEYLPDCGCKL